LPGAIAPGFLTMTAIIRLLGLILVSLPLVHGCSATPKTGQIPSAQATNAPNTGMSATGASERLRFRENLLESHTIYSTCDDLPYIAVNSEGKYFLSKKGDLGDGFDDWELLEENTISSHSGNYLKLNERNGVPIIVYSASEASLSGRNAEEYQLNYCAIINDALSSHQLADIWPQESNALNSINAKNLLRSQASVNQPALLSWKETFNSTPNSTASTTSEINVERGYRSIGGEFMSERGVHQIWPACRDIFNIKPESNCSAPLDVEIGSS
jgi:hypothetical protein